MKLLTIFVTVAFATTGMAGERKDTMCVKQKDGTYKCKASGKIEKVPCCDTPSNEPGATPKPKKKLP